MPVSRLRLAALVAAVGFQLRAAILGVPPVLPAIREDLHLSFTAAGALTAVPVLCLGAAAVPGALLVGRFGARLVVGAGVLGLGLAALLRLSPPLPAGLYAFTALMALSAAIAQPALAVTLRAWFPDAVQRLSTVFTGSLGLGGLAGATLSVHLLGLDGWRGTFVFWSLPALLVGLLWLAASPGRGGDHVREPAPLPELVRDRAVWHVAALFGIQSLVFYTATSWIPFQVRSHGTGYLTLVLLVLNVVSIPLGLLLVALPWPWATSRAFYALSGTLMTVGTAGFAVGLTDQAWLFAGLLGLGTGMTFSGSVALPALLARTSAHVAAYAALALTAGYAIAFVGPLAGGVLVDRTHQLSSPFWLMAAAAAGLVGLGITLPRRPAGSGTGPADAVSGRGEGPGLAPR